VETDLLRDLEVVRTWDVPARAADPVADEDSLGLMEVRFSQFNSWYPISSWWEGNFLERTAPGAFKATIRAHNQRVRKNSSDGVKVLFNHGMDFQIGDKLLGSIESLTEEPDSPVGLVSLDDTSYNRDLLPQLRAGGYGSSFMFQVLRDAWDQEPGKSDYNPDGLPERTIKEVRLFEFGPVTWPANPEASAGMRCVSHTDAYYDKLRSRNPQRVDALRARFAAHRTLPSGAAPDQGTPDDGAAIAPSTAPIRSDHPAGLSAAARQRALQLIS
jgi:HK97 family phage prohead protease